MLRWLWLVELIFYWSTSRCSFFKFDFFNKTFSGKKVFIHSIRDEVVLADSELQTLSMGGFGFAWKFFIFVIRSLSTSISFPTKFFQEKYALADILQLFQQRWKVSFHTDPKPQVEEVLSSVSPRTTSIDFDTALQKLIKIQFKILCFLQSFITKNFVFQADFKPA